MLPVNESQNQGVDTTGGSPADSLGDTTETEFRTRMNIGSSRFPSTLNYVGYPQRQRNYWTRRSRGSSER
jgi:hypothetical protein